MHSENLKALLHSRLDAGINRPLYVIGPPGIGKTQIAKQVADESGIAFRAIHGPNAQVEDLSMPVISADRKSVKFIVDQLFPMVGGKHPERGIFLIDELPQSSADVQKSLANLIQEREIKGEHLLPGWMIVATGNRAADRAGAGRVLSHLMNRMTVVELEGHLDSWCNWYIEQDDCKVECLQFIRFRPDLLLKFDPQVDVNPTPRAWTEGVFATVGLLPADVEHETWKGDVGDGPAAEFKSFLNIFRALPNPDAVLMAPDTHPIPDQMNVRFALAGAIAQRATQDNFDRVLTVAKRIGPEFAVMIVKDAMKRDNRVTKTRAFIKWAQTDGVKILS